MASASFDGVVLATHSGKFHCDEVLGMSMLRCLPQYRSARILRSRDPAELSGATVVIDVGAEFDPSRHRYDHHQRGFTEVLDPSSRDEKLRRTKLSSAGLVYKYFGREILKSHFGVSDPALVETLFNQVYENFVESVDGIDNGIQVCEHGAPRYKIRSDLASRVDRLNPAWNQPDLDENFQFQRAMAVATEEFEAQVNGLLHSWWPARSIVLRAIESRKSVHPSGRVIRLEQPCPYKEHLYRIESELGLGGPSDRILYAVYQDQANKNSWRVQCVSEADDGFKNRWSLPDSLRGLRDEALSVAAGIPGLEFVHASGFIAGAKSEEAAMRLADAAIKTLPQ